MNRKTPLLPLSALLCLGLVLSPIGAGRTTAQTLASSVDPLIGTGGHGHTFPGATTPFGMVQLSPDTRYEGWDACGGYHYSDTTILGFSHLHLSGTGIPDYGDVLFTPTLKTLDFRPETNGRPSYRHRSSFSHADEIAAPGYYGVLLSDERHPRGAHRNPALRFPPLHIPTVRFSGHRRRPRSTASAPTASSSPPSGSPATTRSRATGGRPVGRRTSGSGSWRSSRSPSTDSASSGTIRSSPNRAPIPGRTSAAFVIYRTGKVEEVLVRVGLSTVGEQGARKNLAAEIPDWDFNKVRETSELLWERELSRIVVEGGPAREKKIFYTALYHSMIAPNVANDVDGNYRGMDMAVHAEKNFTMYSVFSLWDTFRALHPLLTMLDPKRTADFIRSMLRKYEEGGVLPVWELASNETWTMIGYHSVPVIADAYAKGVRGFDSALALEAMKTSAGLNRFGLESYRKYGYVRGDQEGESVSKTLEYAYDDWCVSAFAAAVGDPATAAKFDERSQYYQNLFDQSSGFMRPRVNGAWADPFDPRAVTYHYTEANPWQYTFFAPHDVDGLISLFGGKEKFIRKLDSLFYGTSGTTGREQADITGMIGQYAQGNEPSHHVAYLYAHAGSPWKTQKIVRTIMDSLYTDRPDGLCGNDDCGQMSAWYVFSALGFYPVTPGTPLYTVGSPMFPRVRINLPNRKMFIVEARDASSAARYIQTVTLNGRAVGGMALRHDVIASGGEVVFTMGPAPKQDLPGAGPAYAEYLPKKKITAVPYFHRLAANRSSTP